jgi:Fic family protein
LDKELSKDELSFIRKLELQADFKISHLSEKEWDVFSTNFTYNTNAIEGSELTSKEVSGILTENKWPEKSKEDIAEAYGVKEAIKFIRTTKEHLSVQLLKEIHKEVFKNSKSFAGEFRKPGQEVVVMSSSGKVVHEGAPQSRVAGLLQNLVNWYNNNKSKYPGIILASVVHNQFENIHPFADGNGRVGRIILNNILIKHNLPPIDIKLANRHEYYACLQEYENNKNLRPTIEFLLKEYKSTKKEINSNL